MKKHGSKPIKPKKKRAKSRPRLRSEKYPVKVMWADELPAAQRKRYGIVD